MGAGWLAAGCRVELHAEINTTDVVMRIETMDLDRSENMGPHAN